MEKLQSLDRETLKARIGWFGSTYLLKVMVLKGKSFNTYRKNDIEEPSE